MTGFLDDENIIEIENMIFNTTNATDLIKTDEEEYYDGSMTIYSSDNGTGTSSVKIIDCSRASDDTIAQINQTLIEMRKTPSQTIDGIIVYTQSGNSGDTVGMPLYNTVIVNDDIEKIVILESENANETAKRALSLKFN